MAEIKPLPSSKESEMMVLGSMLTNPDGFGIACDALDAVHFFYTEHQSIFTALKKAHSNGKPADVHLVAEELKKSKQLESIGGVEYLITLAQVVGTAPYIEEYIEEVQRLFQARSVYFYAREIEKKVLENGKVESILKYAQERLRTIETLPKDQGKSAIRFLDQFEHNFLTSIPPTKSMLLEFSDEGESWGGFLPKGIVGMLVGAGGVGKTHLLAQLAISIASGRFWLDIFSPTDFCGPDKKGNVFIGLGENQYDDIHRLLHKAASAIEDPKLLAEMSKRIAVFSFCGQQAAFLNRSNPSSYFYMLKRQLIKLAPAEGWSLIILDPISRLLGADAEIDNAAATQFIALLEELVLDLPGSPTVLFAHHVNKLSLREGTHQNQAAARGVSALTDGVRWQANLFRDEESNITLKVTKTNFTAYPKDIALSKDDQGRFLGKKSAGAMF